MKSISKKFFIYVLCALLSVSACSCQYMRSVYAIEYVGGALAFEEALKWLLGAIGIVSAGGMTADYWENHGEEFEEYCAQQNITNAEVAEWQMKLCSGVLDKASSCWSAFKAWASSLISGSSGSDPVFSGYSANDVLNAFFTQTGFVNAWGVAPTLNLPDDLVVYSAYFYKNGNNISGSIYTTNNVEYCNSWVSGAFVYGTSNLENSLQNRVGINGFAITGNWYFKQSISLSDFNTITNSSGYTNSRDNSHPEYSYYLNQNFVNGSGFLIDNPGLIAITGIFDDVVDTGLIALDGVDTANLNIIDSDIVDEENPEVSIPMPGLGVSDDSISSDTYDDIVDAINDGTISLDDGIAQIQDLLRVIVYDDSTDEVVPYQPDPDTGDNKTKDEVIQENRNNMGFTLFGLENVFPFCIPWDIFAFLNVLKADPVAPVFNLPFPNIDDLEHPYMVRVDLSDWDDGMAIFRLAEDFLFIIGLAFLTRSLIGAGGDD